MKMIKFFAAALAIVAAASCTKEHNTNKDANKVHMVFSASVDPETKTKTTLNDHTVEWTESDKILIYGSDPYKGTTGMTYEDLQGTFSVVSGSLSDDKTFADFEGDIVPSDKYFALYPASGWSSTYTDYLYQFSGLANQNAVKGSFDPSKHVMVANTLEDGHFKFRNVCALAKVTVAADEIYSILVTGTTSNGAIGGPFAWNADTFTFKEVGGLGLASITLSNSDGSALENGATYYIVLPLHTISGFTVSICDKSGVVVGSKSKASAFTVERNKIYDLGTLKEPVPEVGDYFYSDGTFGPIRKDSAVGIIFYVGDPTEEDGYLREYYPKCKNGLVMDLEDEWSYRASPEAEFDNIREWTVPYGYESVLPLNHKNNQNNLSKGYSLTRTVKKYSEENSALVKEGNDLLIFDLQKKVAPEGTSGWYVPSCGEYAKMYSAISTLEQAGVDHGLDTTRYYSTLWVSQTGLYDGTLDGTHWGFRVWNATGNEPGEYWRFIFAF